MATYTQEQLDEYRNLLIGLEQKAQENFDRWVITLSGGALGVTFAFLNDILKTNPPIHTWAITLAWGSWAFSITSVLASFFVSQLALRKAIIQTDSGALEHERAGGCYDCVTAGLNILGLVLFLVGVLSAVFFVTINY